jgi:hypothetical protein
VVGGLASGRGDDAAASAAAGSGRTGGLIEPVAPQARPERESRLAPRPSNRRVLLARTNGVAQGVRLPGGSINAPAKLWDIEPLLKCSMRVLRRSVEITARSGL